MADRDFDCVVAGSCVVDILVRPVPLDEVIGGGRILPCEPIKTAIGGITSNSGTAMARLGLRVAAFSYVGDDDWAPIIRRCYEREGIDAVNVLTHPTGATSTTAVLIDPSGERTFAHCVGAPRLMNGALYLSRLDLFARSRMCLMGYFGLLPNLEADLIEVATAIKGVGCRLAMDAAGDGGSMELLARLLPLLDVYVPSRVEAERQTGESDPKRIIDQYRSCGSTGVLGVKLGSQGALLSDAAGRYIEIAACKPPGAVVDTTGAGDAFYGGLLTGLLRGLDVKDAGRLASATGACCVTGLGSTAGLRDYAATAAIAGIG